MKRKTLISIALVLIMLLNCIMPLFVVNAAGSEEIKFNSKLYTAVKKSLSESGIPYTYDNLTYTLFINPEDISRVTKLNLNNGGISDLTGLEVFSSVTHLELSGNNLTKDSNLEVLNSLPLNYLDLSTNNLEDVSAIDGLIDKINSEQGRVILSNQTVTKVEEVVINVKENSNNELTATFELPLILEKAGFLKSVWLIQSGISESGGYSHPTLKSLCNPVTSSNRSYVMNVCSEGGAPYKGLYKLEIYIHDDATEANSAANLNPSATNVLNGSRFYIYVVVHDNYSTAITTPDTNLYKAIKEQLTAGQTVNPQLASYPFNVDSKGDPVYDECTYTTEADGSLFLTVVGQEDPKYVVKNGTVYVIDYYGEYTGTYGGTVEVKGHSYSIYVYNTKVEETILSSADENGVIEYKKGYKVINRGENITLYIKAYDEPKTFVIDNNVLYNKITNLILNNKEIRDLTGIEKFVGLDSYLNVSHNYLSDIDPLYLLQANKDAKEVELQEEFLNWLQNRPEGNLSDSYSKTKEAREGADNVIKQMQEMVEQIKTKLKEASEIEEYTVKETIKETQQEDGSTKKETIKETIKNENYEKEIEAKANEINELIKQFTGYDKPADVQGNVEHVKGTVEILREYLRDATDYGHDLYGYLSKLYEVYAKDYKLTTILTPELNYQTIEEYETYKTATLGTSESVKAMYEAELSRLAKYYDSQALTSFELDLILTAIGAPTVEAGKNPISEYMSEVVSKTVGNRTYWYGEIEKVREAALYIDMITYCRIKRMEEPTGSNQCFVEEYLQKRIDEFQLEGIDANFEQRILDTFKGKDVYTDQLLVKVKEFLKGEYVYKNASEEEIKVPKCQGEYKEFSSLIEEHTTYASVQDIAKQLENVDQDDKELQAVFSKVSGSGIVKAVKILETIDKQNQYKDEGQLSLFKELLALSGRFVLNASETSRYVVLPDLKRLDISYNAYLNGIERISELSGLRELYANADYITDITEVDWSAMVYLRKLGLAYNFIPNIKPLEVLTKIEEIDASHNLIKGEFEFNFSNSQETLKRLDLSSNQITDITDLMEFLDMWSGGDDGNYIAREDTIDVLLHDQTINIEVPDTIWLNEYPETIDLELPKIFTQLAAIDVDRTAFGETSQMGRIESEGKYVTVNTRTPGEKEAIVTVITMSGNGQPVGTCVGDGTTAYIKYVVDQRVVNSITVTPSENVKVNHGGQVQFQAEVEGQNIEDTSVTWAVEGNANEETTVSPEGLLTVAEEETAEKVYVRASSTFDPNVFKIVEVTISDEETPVVESIAVTPSENVKVKKGAEQQFQAEVKGQNIVDNSVIWTVEGNVNEETTISTDGLLKVAEEETAEKVYVKVSSVYNKDLVETVEVTIVDNDNTDDPSDPKDSVVESVTVTPSSNVTAKPGDAVEFTGKAEGTDLTDTSVTWSVEGNTSTGTTISANGVLTIGSNETADKIYVVATSKADNKVSKKVEVTISKSSTPEPVNPNPSLDVELGYTTKDEYIENVAPKTPVEDFKEVLLNGSKYKVVVKENGTEVTSGYMKTGMYAQLVDNDGKPVEDKNGELVVFQVVVKGDVNGDGYANSLDSVLIKSHRAETQLLVGAQFEAADINSDEKVNATDAKLLLYHRAEVKGYDLNYKK